MNNLELNNEFESSLTPEELKIYRKALCYDCSKIVSSKKYNIGAAITSISLTIIMFLMYLNKDNVESYLWIIVGSSMLTFIFNDINRRVFILYKIIQTSKEFNKVNNKNNL